MDESLIFADVDEPQKKQTLGEKLSLISFSHFNLILTAILGMYIWMRGSNHAYNMQAFAIAAGIVTTSWLIQMLISLRSNHG